MPFVQSGMPVSSRTTRSSNSKSSPFAAPTDVWYAHGKAVGLLSRPDYLVSLDVS